VIRSGDAPEIDGTVTKDAVVSIAGSTHLIGFAWAGRHVMLRLDGHLIHAVIDNALIDTWPCPLGNDHLDLLSGARTPSTPLPNRARHPLTDAGDNDNACANHRVRQAHRPPLTKPEPGPPRDAMRTANAPRIGEPHAAPQTPKGRGQVSPWCNFIQEIII
jgi:hypothetical protein